MSFKYKTTLIITKQLKNEIEIFSVFGVESEFFLGWGTKVLFPNPQTKTLATALVLADLHVCGPEKCAVKLVHFVNSSPL